MSMTLIQTVTLSASQTSIGINSIPQTFTDLKIVYSSRVDDASLDKAVYFFISGGGTYSGRRLIGNGSTASSGAPSNAEWLLSQGTATTSNTFSNVEIYLPNYTSTTNKSFSVDAVIENNATSVLNFIGAGLITSTTAIVDLTLALGSGNFVSGTRLSVYGITKGSGGATVS
jgi:hypothetical protein